MGASNWAMCPRCKLNRQAAADTAREKADGAYGRVTLEDFDKVRAEADRLAAAVDGPGIDPTFREDYEITGAEDGAVSVSYGGGCIVCGLSLSFEHTHPLDVEADR